MSAAFRPPHLSVSSVSLYTRCPLQWKQRYVDRVVQPSTAAQATGIAFHKALEALHRGGDAEKTWLSFSDSMTDTLAANGQALTMSKEHGLKLLSAYRKAGLHTAIGEPERKFMLPFPSRSIPVPLLGFIDLAVPTERHYRDFKTTSGRWWTQIKVDLEPQVHAYGWAYQKLYHHRAERALWCVFNTATVQLDVYETAPSPDGFRLFEQQAEATWRGIVDGQYDGCGECSTCKPRAETAQNGPSFSWEE